MNPNIAQISTKKIAKSAASLEPSAMITLFEIDLSELVARGERVVWTNISEPIRSELRFHNNLKLVQNNITWNGDDYFPAPIKASGFETSAKGSPPTPKLTIAINPEGLDEETQLRIKYIKYAIRDLDSLVGAKVTRIRTFAKYIDGANFYDNYGVTTGPADGQQKLKSNILTPPEGFDPDENAYFPKDIYFIDRKSGENKNTVEFELASPFDLQGLKLPGRVVTENSCVWTYRGEGCCYEYTNIKKTDVGEMHHNENSNCKATVDGSAPPVATFKNESLKTIVGVSALIHSPDSSNGYTPGALWNQGIAYKKGQYVRIQLKGVNYYFVSRANGNTANPPPHETFWVADECSKDMKGCSVRWRNNPEIPNQANTTPLPIGAFPTSRRGGSS